jgi:hypothetical protein
MWVLELSLLGVTAYLAWRLHRLELKIEALEHVYNQLADLYDGRGDNE